MHNFHKTNMILWAGIIAGVLILSIIVVYMHTSGQVTPLPDSQEIAQTIFITAIVMLIAILFLKRTVFSPAKIIRNAQNLAESQAEQYVLNKIRRNYLIVWALAELVCLLGFFNFIILADFQNYLIFAVVSLYSLVVNIPREALIIQSLEMLKEQ